MLEHAFVQDIVKKTATLNKFGGYTYSASTTLQGKFRYINSIFQTNNREEVRSDAMAWFPPTASIAKGDILYVDNAYFRVEKLVKARTIDNQNIEFLKCYLLAWKETA